MEHLNHFLCRVILVTLLLSFFTLNATAAPTTASSGSSNADHEILVIGGGPSGLSALSALARVRRKAILFDSGEYRNIATRHMHDVIGNDGTIPAVFRQTAREQIAKYPTVEMINATITSIESVNNGSFFIATDSTGQNYTGRKVVIGSGLKDLIPDTPGLQQLWGKGVFWCPWCDGYEHRDQPMGLLGPLGSTVSSALELTTLNTDVVAYVNGTQTDDGIAALAQKFPDWEAILSGLGVTIDNRTISSITRLNVMPSGLDLTDLTDSPGGGYWDAETGTEYDSFSIRFSDNSTAQRSAFLCSFPTTQASDLGTKLGVQLVSNKLAGNITTDMQTNVPGVYAVGDANNDGSTNVPHAMWSGKNAAVAIHSESPSFARCLHFQQ